MEMTQQWTAKDKAKFYWQLAKGLPNKSDRATLRDIFALCASVQRKCTAMVEVQQSVRFNESRFENPTPRMISHFNRPKTGQGWKDRWKDIYPNLNQAKTAFQVFNEMAYHHVHLSSDILTTGGEREESYGQLVGQIASELNEIADKCNSLSGRMNKRLGTMVRKDRFTFIPFMD